MLTFKSLNVDIQIFEWRKEANNFDKEEEKGRVEEDNSDGKYNSILIANFGYKKGCCSFGLCIQFCEETKFRAWVILRN